MLQMLAADVGGWLLLMPLLQVRLRLLLLLMMMIAAAGWLMPVRLMAAAGRWPMAQLAMAAAATGAAGCHLLLLVLDADVGN